MAIANIISPSDKRPGVYTRVWLGVGLRSSADSTRHVVLFGNKTTTGTAVANVENDVYSEDDARTLFGPGSELFLMVKEAIAAWSGVTLKAIVVTESAGAAGSGTLVYLGAATAAGTAYVTVLGEEIEVPISLGDTATLIGDNVALAINAKTDWPVTAANVLGTVTVTAKNKGPRGNFLALRGRVSAGITTTVTAPALGYLTGGTTSDDPQAALDTLAAVQRRYLVAPYNDATQLAKFQTHVDTQDEPEVGHRKQMVWGAIDTLGNVTSLVTARNFARGQCGWTFNADQPPSVLAAGLASRRAAGESLSVAHNFNGETIPGLKAQYRMADRPSSSQLVAALNNGITPLLSADDGSVYISRSITTHSRDSLGNADYRVLDTCKVSITDEGADRIELGFWDRYRTFNASQDPPDGEASAPGVVTPAMCEDLSYEIASGMEDEGLLESGSVDRLKDQIVWELSDAAPGRFNGVVLFDAVEWANQFCTSVLQVG
jgi:phage tail sheath gpL-like